jgi:hypothetical protein
MTRSVIKTDERPSDWPTERLADRATGRPSDWPTERPSDRLTERPSDRSRIDPSRIDRRDRLATAGPWLAWLELLPTAAQRSAGLRR